ncbi:MAG: transporter family-2 protein [Planctomycetota bacterium]|jgi:transporter family-2 protein
MQSGLFIMSALLIGAISTIYLPMNSSVSRYLGSPLTANVTFCLGALALKLLSDARSPG